MGFLKPNSGKIKIDENDLNDKTLKVGFLKFVM